MRSWITDVNREMIPYAVGITKYLIVNEQITERAILRFETKIGSSPMTVS